MERLHKNGELSWWAAFWVIFRSSWSDIVTPPVPFRPAASMCNKNTYWLLVKVNHFATTLYGMHRKKGAGDLQKCNSHFVSMRSGASYIIGAAVSRVSYLKTSNPLQEEVFLICWNIVFSVKKKLQKKKPCSIWRNGLL